MMVDFSYPQSSPMKDITPAWRNAQPADLADGDLLQEA
jgi:hypothetical protein